MSKSIKSVIVGLAASAATVTPALATQVLPPTQLPFGEVSVLGLVAGTVIAGVWIARRRR